MTQQFTPVFYKVLYSNFGFIFDELERDNPGFFEMNRDKQWTLLKTKVEGMIPAAPVITPFPKV
jgi:hypothetical protein